MNLLSEVITVRGSLQGVCLVNKRICSVLLKQVGGHGGTVCHSGNRHLIGVALNQQDIILE